jgi:hypothetical protein
VSGTREHRREMKAIDRLGTIDRLFGVAVTTRGWNTISSMIKSLRVLYRR